MKKSPLIFVLALGLLTVIGCTKYPDLYDSERQKDVTITYYDTTNNFNQYKTYYVDTVYTVTEDANSDSLKTVPSSKSNLIIAEITKQMNAKGFVLVDTASNPDLVIHSSTMKLNVTTTGSSCGGYGGYGWGYPSYGWGYPSYGYYYPYCYPYSYDQNYGTLVMDIADNKNRDNIGNFVKIIWTGRLAGGDNTSYTMQDDRITSGIKEAFAQSPYLKATE